MDIIKDALAVWLVETEALGVKNGVLTYFGEVIPDDQLKHFSDDHFEEMRAVLSLAVDIAQQNRRA